MFFNPGTQAPVPTHNQGRKMLTTLTGAILTLQKEVRNTLLAADSPDGFFTFTYNADRDVAKGAYGKADFPLVGEAQPYEFVVNVRVPQGFTNRELAAEAVYRIVVNNLAYSLPGVFTYSYSEDALRRELRKVRELAVQAATLGLDAEESFFDDQLLALKTLLRPLVEARRERIEEQRQAAVWI
jgi:hypothetical protein